MDIRKLCLALCLACALPAQAQEIDLNTTEAYSPYIFGHNLEHTRSAVMDGLSAQMLHNRKFAGKPMRNQGVSLRWFPIGERVFFLKDNASAYTRHICLPDMHRLNERSSQIVQNLVAGQTAGIGQYGLTLEEGRAYELRTVTRVSVPLTLKVELTDRAGLRVYACHTLSLVPGRIGPSIPST